VIAVPTIDLAQTVVDVDNCSGAQFDRFETFGSTTMPHAPDAKDTFRFPEIALLAILKGPLLGAM
jgi:hypothetical protein